jgi:hypothetical protein
LFPKPAFGGIPVMKPIFDEERGIGLTCVECLVTNVQILMVIGDAVDSEGGI